MFNPSGNNLKTLGSDMSKRGQYVTTSNELNKEVNRDVFVKGNIKKDELDKRLEELSYQGGIQISGNLARMKILENSTSQRDASNPKMVDTVVTEYVRDTKVREKKKEDNPVYVSSAYEKYSGYTVNRGKEIMDRFKSNSSKTTVVRLKKSDKN